VLIHFNSYINVQVHKHPHSTFHHYFIDGYEVGMHEKTDNWEGTCCDVFLPPRKWNKKLLKSFTLVDEVVLWKKKWKPMN